MEYCGRIAASCCCLCKAKIFHLTHSVSELQFVKFLVEQVEDDDRGVCARKVKIRVILMEKKTSH